MWIRCESLQAIIQCLHTERFFGIYQAEHARSSCRLAMDFGERSRMHLGEVYNQKRHDHDSRRDGHSEQAHVSRGV